MELGKAFVTIEAQNKLAAGLSAAEGQVKKTTEAMAAKLAGIGKAMTLAGGVITGAMGLMGKAAIDEEININRLATTMKNVGVSYDSVRDSLEAVIATTQRKTGVADNEQRDILNRLILTTGDYKTALELLPTVLDLAAAGEMDATTAATYLGKAHNELAKGAETVSVRFGQASLQFKSMEDIQNRVAGSAEALANPLNILKASIGDVAETIGAFLIPTIKNAVDKIADIAIKVQEWANAHKPLVETIVKFIAIAGGIMVVLGPILMMLPGLVTAFSMLGAVIAAICSPIGLVIAAVAALYLAWITNFGGIRDFIIAVVEKVKEVLGWLWDKVIWVAESLGLIKKPIEEVVTVTDKLAIAEKEAGDKAKGAVTGIDNFADAMEGLETQTDETKTALNEFGQVIETFDEWVARLAEETKTRNEEILKSTQELADTMQPIYDRLYEMSHTEEEVTIRNLTAQKDAQIKAVNALNLSVDAQAAAIAKITELYNIEVGLIIAKLEEERKKLIEIATTENTSANERMAAIRKINVEYDTQIAKVNAVATATEESAKRQVGAYQRIYDAAGKLTTIKLPGGGTISTEPITAPNVGAEYYAPKLKHGTPYVPKTGLYQLHQGEAVIPANQLKMKYIEQQLRNLRIYNEMVEEKKSISHLQNPISNTYSFSPIVNLTVSGGGNASNIAYEVKKVLDESIRQFRRSGFELVPGRG